jgi:hypothetical protein
MNEPEIDPNGGRTMAGEKGRMPCIVVTALLVIALGIVAVTLRYKVTVIDNTVLLLERWTGRVTLIHKDGSFTRMEKGNPRSEPGFGLLKLFKSGGKTVPQPGKAVKKGPGTRQTGSKEAVTPKKSDADSIQKPVKKTASPASPFASGTTTSKDLADTGAKVYSSIKWQEEKVLFQMAIRPYTDGVKKLRREKKEPVCIDLIDEKGVTIQSLTIPAGDMKAVRDENSKITGLEYVNSIPLGRTDFLSIQDWRIRAKA